MKNKLYIKSILILIVGVLLLTGSLINHKNKQLDKNDLENIEFAIYLENVKTTTFPSKDSGYYYDPTLTSCSDGSSIEWNYELWYPIIKNVNKTKTKCTLYFREGYTDPILNGTDPILANDLIPVNIADDGTVTQADLGTEWYNYSDKQWANAIILNESFNETTLYDLSGNNFHGTFFNGTQIKEDTEGRIGIYFDGVDDYVDIVDISETIDFESGFTIEYEVKYESFQRWSRIFDLSNEENSYMIFSSNRDETNDIYLGGRIGVVSEHYQDVWITNQIPLNKKITVKWMIEKIDGNYKLSLYQDGILISERIIGEEYFKNALYTDNYLGKSFSEDDGYFNGYIYELKFTDNNGNPILWYDIEKETKINEVIPEEYIESYFVWIPKYRYQLWNLGNYETLTTIENKERVIPIIFGDYNTSDSIAGECTTPMTSSATGSCSTGDYMTHPAFLSIPSTGFWIGKFETGTTLTSNFNVRNGEAVQIKPNISSWRSIQVANAFYTSYDYNRELDSHMMKNTEWGAVAYLAWSNYGLGLTDIRMNNNGNYLTGYAAVKAPTCGYTTNNATCNTYGTSSDVTQAYNTTTGYMASTTGNISGIYDMSGGSWEYVMGVMLDQNGKPASGRNNTYNSNFIGTLTYPNDGSNTSKTSWTASDGGIDWPKKNYYDEYRYYSSQENFLRRILGDATGELGGFGNVTYTGTTTTGNTSSSQRPISSWFTDQASFIHLGNPWFLRGGYVKSGLDAGFGAFGIEDGRAAGASGFRVVLTP